MTGAEFVRKIKELARKRDNPCSYMPERGKGSHGTLYFGDRFTIVRNLKDELKTGTFHDMLKQLNLHKNDR